MAMILEPGRTFVDNSNRILASGTVRFCEPGTGSITLKATYPTDADLLATTNANANPLTLNSAGRLPAQAHGNGKYRIVVRDSLGNTIYDISDVNVSDAAALTFTPSSGAAATDIQTFLRSIYERTELEEAALITPTDYQYLPGHVMRYANAVGDGTASDSAALSAACSTGHQVLGGGPEFTYRVDSAITLTRAIRFDGQGCTIKPNGNSPCFVRNTSALATTTASSGATQGSRSIVVADATSITVGVWLAIYVVTGTAEDYRPYAWVTVTGVSGTTITFDRPLAVDYSGGAEPVVVAVYSTAAVLSHAHFKNTRFDGSACTYTASLGQGLRLGGFRLVTIENCEAFDFDNVSTETEAFTIHNCIDVMLRNNTFRGQIAGNQQAGIFYCRTAMFDGNRVDGSAFGVAAALCENGIAIGNVMQGRSKQEVDDSVSPLRSTRGVKMLYVARTLVNNNSISDYESGIKVESCWRYIITNNHVFNASLGNAYVGQSAVNVSNQVTGTNTLGGVISGNVVENCSGNGIVATDDVAGLITITGNVVRECVANAIATTNPRNVIISNNVIEDWANAGGSYYAVLHTNGAANITNNRFVNSDNTRTCISVSTVSGQKMVSRDNVAVSGNPLGFTVENSGTATIASGTTSIAVAHGLSVTPAASDIFLTPTENGTADPGTLWVSSIGATNFTINCRTDPGASNLDVAWRVDVRMPYTA